VLIAPAVPLLLPAVLLLEPPLPPVSLPAEPPDPVCVVSMGAPALPSDASSPHAEKTRIEVREKRYVEAFMVSSF
jgi:hypothetical protein